MEALWSSVLVLILVTVFLATGVWIFAAMILVAMIGMGVVLGFPIDRMGAILAKITYRAASGWELAAIPLFVWVGEVIFRTDLSDRLYRGLAPLVNWLPGCLIHTNIIGCTIVAALNGTSTATTAIVGKITLPELNKREYDRSLSIGTLAGSGGLGMLIPPSVPFIIYGVLAEVSIAKLFAAGIFPGLTISAIYTAYIVIRCFMDPSLAPKTEGGYRVADYIRCIGLLSPMAIIILIILGSIYSGFATPTEAAAVAAVSTLVIAFLLRELTWKIFTESILGAVKVSCMVCSIMMCASFLSTAMGFLHMPQDVSRFIASMNLSPYALIALLYVFYFILGMLLDGVSIMVMSLPICLPLILNAGYDPIWFGVFLVIMIEIGLVTPPFGINLFIIQGIAGVPVEFVARASVPFWMLMTLSIIILLLWPQIALWLPSMVIGK